jgi:hypothetical protein
LLIYVVYYYLFICFIYFAYLRCLFIHNNKQASAEVSTKVLVLLNQLFAGGNETIQDLMMSMFHSQKVDPDFFADLRARILHAGVELKNSRKPKKGGGK